MIDERTSMALKRSTLEWMNYYKYIGGYVSLNELLEDVKEHIKQKVFFSNKLKTEYLYGGMKSQAEEEKEDAYEETTVRPLRVQVE